MPTRKSRRKHTAKQPPAEKHREKKIVISTKAQRSGEICSLSGQRVSEPCPLQHRLHRSSASSQFPPGLEQIFSPHRITISARNIPKAPQIKGLNQPQNFISIDRLGPTQHLMRRRSKLRMITQKKSRRQLRSSQSLCRLRKAD